MIHETPKPWLGRLTSYLSLAFISSTLNPFHQASSSFPSPSPPHHDDNPKPNSPESTLQMSDSDMGMAPQSSAIPYGEENSSPLLSSPLFRRSQVNSIAIFTTRVSSSSPYSKHSHDPNSPKTNPQISYSEEDKDELLAETTSGRRDPFLNVMDIRDSSIPSYPSRSLSAIFSRQASTVSSFSSEDSFPAPATTQTPQPAAEDKFLHVIEIMDEQDLGKHLLGLAIPMGVGLVISANALVKTTEMHIVAVALSFAIAFIWNGILLRKTYSKSSTFILISGAALMMLAFYAFVGCFLPLYLKWIPALCWSASLVPFSMYGLACFRRETVNDPENGKT